MLRGGFVTWALMSESEQLLGIEGYSLVQQIFIECLLDAKHCFR